METPAAHPAPMPVEATGQDARRLCRLAAELHSRGWCPGTGGNFSVRLPGEPFRLLVTPSGVDKGSLRPEDLVTVDGEGRSQGAGRCRPSAETPIHVVIARHAGAAVTLHTHSVAATLVSEHFAPQGAVTFSGYEMLKGLRGIDTHEAAILLPVLANSQDVPALSRRIERLLVERPGVPGLLLGGHGLYTWGASFEEGRRHVETLEFLLECVARRTPFAPYTRAGEIEGGGAQELRADDAETPPSVTCELDERR